MHARSRWGRALPLLLSLAGCVGEIGDVGSQPAEAPPALPALAPAAPTLHRLTAEQIQSSYLDLLGEPLALPTELPADDQLYGFTSISAAGKTISTVDAEQYERAAYAVLEQVFADPVRRDALVGCVPASAADPCVRAFLESFTQKAWRGPVDAEAIDALVALGDGVAQALGDASLGVKFALAAVLQSPTFLFRVEVGEPDPDNPALLRYTSWEMASRLSYLITDSPPDEELLDAAATGALLSRDTLAMEAGRLVDDPRARPALVRFFRDFMNIRRLDMLDKSPDKFPAFSATLGPAMRVELERMFESVVFDEDSDFRQLFTTRETFLNEELARVYGIVGIHGPDFVPVTLPEGGTRAGIFTTPGFLSVNAHKTQTSPTHRGRFIRINLLCQDVPPPPPGVNTSLPETDPGQPAVTLREKLEAHRENPQCAGCHVKMDPIGFAFEHFDAIGGYRDRDENDLAVDSSADLDGDPAAGAVEMGELIAALPGVSACVARRFYEHAGAHLAEPAEEVAVQALVQDFIASDYNFKALVVSLVTNDGFRYATPAAAE